MQRRLARSAAGVGYDEVFSFGLHLAFLNCKT
jgi:hypothetical protein